MAWSAKKRRRLWFAAAILLAGGLGAFAITLALGKLTALGYLRSRRGAIAVIQREGLERLVCDCYWIGQEKVKPDFDKRGSARTILCFD